MRRKKRKKYKRSNGERIKPPELKRIHTTVPTTRCQMHHINILTNGWNDFVKIVQCTFNNNNYSQLFLRLFLFPSLCHFPSSFCFFLLYFNLLLSGSVDHCTVFYSMCKCASGVGLSVFARNLFELVALFQNYRKGFTTIHKLIK